MCLIMICVFLQRKYWTREKSSVDKPRKSIAASLRVRLGPHRGHGAALVNHDRVRLARGNRYSHSNNNNNKKKKKKKNNSNSNIIFVAMP